MAVSAISSGASAQQKAPSAEELKAAREMFQEAYKDEQEKRFAQALEKFQRVASVKESASVRYRIGAVLEQLGRLREARDAFRALAASKPNLSTPEQEIADNAAERAHQLDKKIPKIVLRLQDNSPADARVSIDGAPVPASTSPRQVELDPGEHLVQASSPTSRPSESKVTLTEGGEVEVMVVLTPLKAAKLPPPPPPAETAGPHRDRTLAYIALGAGGVLLVTGLVLLGIREGDISDIKKACGVDGNCPAGKRATLESARDEAELFGPLGVGLGLVGLAAAGTGVYLLVRPEPAQATPANGTTTPAPHARVRVSPRPLQGGAMLGVSTSF
jgi:tetratricopeptide (TPR) repeat protein